MDPMGCFQAILAPDRPGFFERRHGLWSFEGFAGFASKVDGELGGVVNLSLLCCCFSVVFGGILIIDISVSII